MSSIKTTQIDGDVSVGRNVAIGGSTTVQGNSQLKGNVKVDGWLEAPNIKAANKGLFQTLEDAKKTYTEPENGWWIIVGGLPGDIYVGKDGQWISTGEKGGNLDIDITPYLDDLAKKDLSNVDMNKYFRTEVDVDGKVTKAGDAGDASWFETRWDGTTFDGKEEEVTRRQMKIGESAIGVTTDGRAYVEKDGNCKTLLKEENLDDYAQKDLTNVSLSAFRNKNIYPVSSFVYWVDADHTVTPSNAEALAQILYSLSNTPGSLLYAESIASAGGDIGLSPVSFALMAEDPIDYSLSFFGNDEYLHVLRVNGLGAITRQYAYRLDDMATKSFITSSGYRPMRVIDLGSYRDGAFSLDGTPYWGDMQTTLYSYLDGGCGVLLRAHTQYEEPLVFVPTRIYRSGGTLYVIEFMVSATQLCEIRIDEDADAEGGESLFSQQFTAIGSGGGSGTVTTEVYSDINDYNEVK